MGLFWKTAKKEVHNLYYEEWPGIQVYLKTRTITVWYQYLEKTHIANWYLLEAKQFRCPLATSSVEDRICVLSSTEEDASGKWYCFGFNIQYFSLQCGFSSSIVTQKIISFIFMREIYSWCPLPLIIQTPREHRGFVKEVLGVIWRSNQTRWMIYAINHNYIIKSN